MIIVQLDGGLGNQMFQVAFSKALQANGFDVKLDINSFNDDSLHNGLEVMSLFDVGIGIASKELISEFKDERSKYIGRLFRKVFGYKSSHFIETNYSEFKIRDDKYYQGYWQSEKYFTGHVELIKEMFSFPDLQGKNNKMIADEIESCDSVAIHVRRGDYITNNRVYKEYGSICDKIYYNNAIGYIAKKVANPKYFVFSNDIEWCKDNLDLSGASIFINWNIGSDSYIDMQLMSMCKHNIIANSSFSWWSAWLGKAKEKIVIAPSIWKFSEGKNKSRTPDGWIRI